MKDPEKITIKGGLYLVVDPKPGSDNVFPKVEKAIQGGVDILQIWDNWSDDQNQKQFILQICSLAHDKHLPVLINENWSWLTKTPLDGVHFDQIPQEWDELNSKIGRPFITGLTCGNDFERIEWAVDHGMDYISFCAMFPSPSVNNCPIVHFDTVKEARKLTGIPIFASGGINTDNLGSLLDLGINGVAVISGIMKNKSPEKAAALYKQILNKHQKEKIQ